MTNSSTAAIIPLLAIAAENVLTLWDPVGGTTSADSKTTQERCLPGRITDLTFNHNGQVLAVATVPSSSSNNSGMISLFSVATLQVLDTIPWDNAQSIRFGGRSRYLCVTNDSDIVTVWDLKKMQVARSLKSSSHSIDRAVWDVTSTLIYATSVGQTAVDIFHVKDGRLHIQIEMGDAIQCMEAIATVTKDGDLVGSALVIGGRHGITSWNGATHRPKRHRMPHQLLAADIAVMTSSSSAAAAAAGHNMALLTRGHPRDETRGLIHVMDAAYVLDDLPPAGSIHDAIHVDLPLLPDRACLALTHNAVAYCTRDDQDDGTTLLTVVPLADQNNSTTKSIRKLKMSARPHKLAFGPSQVMGGGVSPPAPAAAVSSSGAAAPAPSSTPTTTPRTNSHSVQGIVRPTTSGGTPVMTETTAGAAAAAADTDDQLSAAPAMFDHNHLSDVLDAVDQCRAELQHSMRAMHLDVLRQLQQQSDDLHQTLRQQAHVLDDLAADNRALRRENQALRRAAAQPQRDQ